MNHPDTSRYWIVSAVAGMVLICVKVFLQTLFWIPKLALLYYILRPTCRVACFTTPKNAKVSQEKNKESTRRKDQEERQMQIDKQKDRKGERKETGKERKEGRKERTKRKKRREKERKGQKGKGNTWRRSPPSFSWAKARPRLPGLSRPNGHAAKPPNLGPMTVMDQWSSSLDMKTSWFLTRSPTSHIHPIYIP